MLIVVVPSLFFFHVEPSLPVMVEPAAALETKFFPLSEPIEYEPFLPLALSDPLEPEEPDEPPEDEPPLALAAAEAALAAPAAALIKAPSPIYFTPFPRRPSRCRITASCSRVSGLCGLVPSIIPASVAACQASFA